jgi:tetratricopeptide (TPR) repeat protein
MLAGSSAADIERQLGQALADFIRRADAGDIGARAARELVPVRGEGLLAEISVGIAGRMAGEAERDGDATVAELQALAPAAYELAGEMVEAGRFREAVVLLCAIAGLRGGEFDGLLGLAVCALRLGRPEVALALAQECLKRDPRHPRACCIAAHCELKRGDRRTAQHYFALAARVARTRPEFREDLRSAQRALLLMHLA